MFKSLVRNPNFSSVHDVSSEELKTQLDQVVLIDVREPNEFTGELGHIENAQLLPLRSLPETLGSLAKDKTIVFVCRSGGRSAQATAFALESGYSKVYNLAGGMLHWNHLQLDVVK